VIFTGLQIGNMPTAARLAATGFTADDIGKIAKQTDTGYILGTDGRYSHVGANGRGL
jgi:hypothetical protein